MAQRPSLALALTLGSIVVLFVALLVVMGRLGFFTFTGNDPSSKVVAASLALVGAFVGAAVSIVGTVVKYSIDQQTAAQQQIEKGRAEALQRDAEKRLGLEAAVRALQLFSTSAGSPTPDIQREGALFMLANLDQHELTLQLVDELLSKGDVSMGAASSVINRALRHGSEDEKIRAITVLYDHAGGMASPLGIFIPECIEKCDADFSPYVREWVVVSLGEIMLGLPVQEWTSRYVFKAFSVIAALGIAWIEEPLPELKLNAGAILRPILSAFPQCYTLKHPRMDVDTDLIRGQVAELLPNNQAAEDLVKRLTQWAAAGTVVVPGPGAAPQV
jgi:hypothetical protein